MMVRLRSTRKQQAILTESFLLMGTVVHFHVVGPCSISAKQQSIARALESMRRVEEVCSRFDSGSELRQLCQRPGQFVAVSPILYHALEIALATSELTGGVFDPTVGRALELQGFSRNYLTGDQISTPTADPLRVSHRDIHLDPKTRSVILDRPVALDLGAVAKGLAVDLAVAELQTFEGYAIDAGGDAYVGGLDPSGAVWTIGIEDPHLPGRSVDWLGLSNQAVCTSGSYKRISPTHPEHHHLYHPLEARSAQGWLSMTVVAPLAVLADVSATAAFVLGPTLGLAFVESQKLAAYGITEQGETVTTSMLSVYRR